MGLNLQMTVQELFEQHPAAVKVFIKQKMLCVGCPTQGYHSLEDVARIYGLTLCSLMKKVQDAIQHSNEQIDIRQIHRKEAIDETELGK